MNYYAPWFTYLIQYQSVLSFFETPVVSIASIVTGLGRLWSISIII